MIRRHRMLMKLNNQYGSLSLWGAEQNIQLKLYRRRFRKRIRTHFLRARAINQWKRLFSKPVSFSSLDMFMASLFCPIKLSTAICKTKLCNWVVPQPSLKKIGIAIQGVRWHGNRRVLKVPNFIFIHFILRYTDLSYWGSKWCTPIKVIIIQD